MRVLFTTNPLLGHWLPMAPLAAAARDAGHDVVVASGPDLVGDIDRRGLTAWEVGPDLASTWGSLRNRPRSADETSEQSQVRDGLAMFGRPAMARVAGLQARAADWPPDLVVSEIYELAGAWVPAPLHVLHGLGAHFPGFLHLAGMLLDHVTAAAGPPAWSVPMADTDYLDPFPPALQPPQDRPFGRVLPIGPASGSTSAQSAPSISGWADRIARLPHERTVYVTLGTVFSAAAEFAPILDAVTDLGLNAVVTSGPDVDPADLGAPSESVLVERFVPQAEVLPHCAAVVCHGGAGTLLGALGSGLPVVCLPRGADQFGNAAAAARAGAGIALTPDRSSRGAIAEALYRVLDDPRFASVARGLQAQIAAMPAPVDVLETLAVRLLARTPGSAAG